MAKSQLTKAMDKVAKTAKDIPKTAPRAKISKSIPKAPKQPNNIYEHIDGM